MPDAVFITSGQKRDQLPSGEYAVSNMGILSVNAIRFVDERDLLQCLEGMTFDELREGARQRLAMVRIIPPDGRPLEQFSDGYPTISEVSEAVEVACRALANPNSDARQFGFTPNTPIYFWQYGEKAKLQHCSNTE